MFWHCNLSWFRSWSCVDSLTVLPFLDSIWQSVVCWTPYPEPFLWFLVAIHRQTHRLTAFPSYEWQRSAAIYRGWPAEPTRPWCNEHLQRKQHEKQHETAFSNNPKPSTSQPSNVFPFQRKHRQRRQFFSPGIDVEAAYLWGIRIETAIIALQKLLQILKTLKYLSIYVNTYIYIYLSI